MRAQVSYKIKSLCTTRFGTKSVAPKSTSYAITVPITYRKKVTVTPIKTITPPASSTTVTTTQTSTVVETTTPTTVITSIETAISTDTQTSTATAYSTTTIVTTTTAAAPAGPPAFTPLASQPDYRPKKRSLLAESRIVRRQVKYSIKPPTKAGGKPMISPALFPKSTICVVLVQAITTSTKTFTASSTTTTTLPAVTSTVTSTATATITTTTVGAPSLTTTVSTATVGTTTTTTTTTTSTVTETQTVEVPAPTGNVQCQSNNIVGAANGNQGFSVLSFSGSVDFNVVNVPDAASCCVTCQQTAGCAYYVFFVPRECYIVSPTDPNTCDASQVGAYYSTSSGLPANSVFIGNGQCGRYANGGSG